MFWKINAKKYLFQFIDAIKIVQERKGWDQHTQLPTVEKGTKKSFNQLLVAMEDCVLSIERGQSLQIFNLIEYFFLCQKFELD